MRTFCFLRACLFEDGFSICNVVFTTLFFESFTIVLISLTALLQNVVSVIFVPSGSRSTSAFRMGEAVSGVLTYITHGISKTQDFFVGVTTARSPLVVVEVSHRTYIHIHTCMSHGPSTSPRNGYTLAEHETNPNTRAARTGGRGPT